MDIFGSYTLVRKRTELSMFCFCFLLNWECIEDITNIFVFSKLRACSEHAQSNVALFINNSDLLFAKQLLQSTNEKIGLEAETSDQASAELWKRLVDFLIRSILSMERVRFFDCFETVNLLKPRLKVSRNRGDQLKCLN